MKLSNNEPQSSEIGLTPSGSVKDWLWFWELCDRCSDFYQNSGRLAAMAYICEAFPIEAFRQGLNAPHAVVRRRAVHVASLMPREAAIEGLERVLSTDECPVVRHEAAFCLGALGANEALSVLVKAMLHDPDPLVRHEAAEALGDMRAEEARSQLYLAKQDPCEAVQRTAAIALQLLDWPHFRETK